MRSLRECEIFQLEKLSGAFNLVAIVRRLVVFPISTGLPLLDFAFLFRFVIVVAFAGLELAQNLRQRRVVLQLLAELLTLCLRMRFGQQRAEQNHLPVFLENLDEVEAVVAEKQDHLVFAITVVVGVFENTENLVGLGLRHERVLKVVSQTTLQPSTLSSPIPETER